MRRSPGREFKIGRRPTVHSPESARAGCKDHVGVAKWIVLGVLLFFALCSFYMPSTVGQDSGKRILILTGYSPSSPAVQTITQSLRTTVRNGTQVPIDFLYEFQ